MPSLKPDRPVFLLLDINMMLFNGFLVSFLLPSFSFSSFLLFFILSLHHSFLHLYSSAIFHFNVSIYNKESFKTSYVFIKKSLMVNDLNIELFFKQTSHFVIEISSLFSSVKGILSWKGKLRNIKLSDEFIQEYDMLFLKMFILYQ